MYLRKRSTLLASASLILCTGLPFASAQSTSSLQGAVTDPVGAAIPSAQVEVVNEATGVSRSVTSDNSGNYVVPSLQPGNYSIHATASGFAPQTLAHIALLVSQTTTVNVKVSVSAQGETVQVSGAAPTLDAQTITVGQAIDQRTVQNIPLNGRHFLDLTQLVPGSVTAPASGNLTSPSRGLGANSFITAGNREDSANFMINGINLNDLSQNQITFQPSINTTAEFKIINSTPSAEYGRSSGPVVNIATKSGTNDLHGEMFDYLRNNDLDARNYFNRHGTAMNTLQRNNFGGALGGPIQHDKTFFFLSYEGLRQAQQLNLKSGVLSSAQRAALAASPAGPAYAGLLNLIPTANDATGTQFTGSSAGPVSVNQYTVDLFDALSPKDQLHLYYAFQQDVRTEPNLQGNTIPGFGDHRNSHRQIGTINEVHIFNADLVNEARVGFSRIAIAFSENTALNPATYGISTGVIGNSGLPQISIPTIGLNFGGPGGFPQGRYDTTGVFSDTLSYLRGNHNIRAGGEFRRVVGDSFSADPGTLAFSSVNSFVNGQVNSFAITPSRVTSRLFTNAAAGFLQDDYKATRHLTLELGFRFEWNGTPTEGANRLINFLPASASLVRINSNGYSDAYNQNYNYEPRVGFTWDAYGAGRTILRGGFGIEADQPTLNAVTGLASNTPLANPVSFTASSTAPPAFVGSIYQSAGASGLAPSAVNTRLSNGYVESFNLNLQQELGAGTVMQIGYIGSLGRHLRLRENLNQPTLTGNSHPYPRLSASSPIAPSRTVGNIAYVDSSSFSDYNALWFTIRKNLSHGIEVNSTYTWSKSMDLNSLGSQGGYTLQNNFNPRGDYGLSDFDVRNRFVFSGIWNLPLHGDRLRDGWQLANITQLQGGNPFSVTTTSTYNGTSGTIRPSQIGSYSTGRTLLANGNVGYLNAVGCATGAVTAACSFYAPATGFGNLRRNGIIGPGFADSDVSLQKTTQITERTSFLIRADAFDFLNHASFGQPSTSISTTAGTSTAANSTFGQLSATRFPVGDLGSSRQLQFALKLLF